MHEKVLSTVWPAVARALLDADVQLLCDPATLSALSSLTPAPPKLTTHVRASTPAAYTTEHLSLTLSVLAQPSLAAAIQHINAHSSHHTDCIVTENRAAARTFIAQVDSAVVMVNASTRFTDGGEFGFGAEIGISTQKLHARGPMALAELTTTKWIVDGDGQIR